MAEEKSKGLPMTARWDPEMLVKQTETLKELQQKPLLTRIRGYMNLTGPAWLQSAMTLGAGSATASVVAGRFFGYQFLWVQPLAMFLGVMMLAALGNIVLSTGERPYRSFARELHPIVPLLWAIGTIVASIVWHFPQYTLAAAVTWDLAQVAGAQTDAHSVELAVKIGIGLAILGINIFTTWNYGSGARGIKIYEGFLRWTIRLVILAFLAVVVMTPIDWMGVLRGFFTFQLPKDPLATTTVLGAIGAAVGINMTFLYPYSMLAKGWGRYHKGLSRWDLFSSMFLPYTILTSLIIIAMAATGYDPAVPATPQAVGAFSPQNAAQALSSIFSSSLGRVIFDLGFLGMALGAISTHMVVCGFTMCEMLGLEYTVTRYRLFTLIPAIGVMGVVWKAPFWLPVAASAICLTMMPFVYLTFFVLNNKRSFIGDAVGRGWTRAAFNFVLLLAIAATTIGTAVKIKTGVIDKVWPKATGAPASNPAEPVNSPPDAAAPVEPAAK
ncbi:MAG: divalent metal cation transporter [Planctomycetota bacterium]